jgi:hypothetical protein
MQSVENTSKLNFVTVAGWTTPYTEATLDLYLQPTPRPFSYGMQLRADARAYKPWLFWIGGGGLIVLGLALLYWPRPAGEAGGTLSWLGWPSILFGGLVLAAYFRMFLQAVHWTRTAPLGVGVVRTLQSLPPWPDLALAEAVDVGGAVIEVTVARAVVVGLLEVHGECEILFYKRPRPRGAKCDTGVGIAARRSKKASGTFSG